MVELSVDELKNVLNEENYNLEYRRLDSNRNIYFKSTKYSSNFLLNLKEFKDAEKFCDIVLLTSMEPYKYIKAHKVVLASSSPYFKALLAGGFKENNKCDSITIDNISFSILDTIVNFVYTSEVLVNETNVQHLLPAASLLQIEDLVNACCIYLSQNMDSNNCIGIEAFAREYGCVNLAKYAQLYMKNHFCEVVNSEEFLHLNENQLCKLLQNDELSVRCESFVFKAVVDWVKFEPENRRKSLDHLITCVRIHLLPPKFLKEQMKNCEIFQSNEIDKSRQHLQSVYDRLICHLPCDKSGPRSSTCALYVLGGYQRQSLGIVECFRKATNSWERCSDMLVPRSGVCCVTLALYIYAIGGRNNNNAQGNMDCADVECYDPFTNHWRKCKDMQVPRSRAGAGVIDGVIYAVGGAHGCKFHSSVERYFNDEDRWEYVASMKRQRIGLGCCVVRRLLYAVGGFDGKERLNHVEVYDPDKDTWNMVAPMNVPRSGAGVVSFDNYIFAVGGYTTNLQLDSAERYDTLTDQWTFIKPMSSPRSALAAVSFKCGRILAFGGYNGVDFVSTVEMLDPNTGDWLIVGNLTSERSGHGAAMTIDFVH